MIKYAKLIDEKTGLCEVGMGTDSYFYKSIGMKEMEVSESDIDKQWYLTEKCRMYTTVEILENERVNKIAEINTAKENAFKEGIIFNGAHFTVTTERRTERGTDCYCFKLCR